MPGRPPRGAVEAAAGPRLDDGGRAQREPVDASPSRRSSAGTNIATMIARATPIETTASRSSERSSRRAVGIAGRELLEQGDRGGVGVAGPSRDRADVVARCLHGVDQVGASGDVREVADRRHLRGEVDAGRLDAFGAVCRNRSMRLTQEAHVMPSMGSSISGGSGVRRSVVILLGSIPARRGRLRPRSWHTWRMPPSRSPC